MVKPQCYGCHTIFNNQNELKDHSNVHSDIKLEQYQCKICLRVLKNAFGLQNHSLTHSEERPYTCEVCDKSFKKLTIKRRHMETHTHRKYQCEVCKNEFINYASILRHEILHSAEGTAKKKSSTNKWFTCDICKKLFSLKNTFDMHMMSHLGIRPHKCDLCDMCFTQKGDLVRHKMRHTNTKPFACDICQKAFIQKSTMVRHMNSHANIKPYTCTLCGKGFSRSWGLKSHSLQHLEQKVRKCSKSTLKSPNDSSLVKDSSEQHYCIICEKAYSSRYKLKDHLDTHSDKYKCSVCQKHFCKSTLKSHMLTHNQEKLFECSVCEKRFTQSSNLKRHTLTHLNFTGVRCIICKELYPNTPLLKQHTGKHLKLELMFAKDENMTTKQSVRTYIVPDNLPHKYFSACGNKLSVLATQYITAQDNQSQALYKLDNVKAADKLNSIKSEFNSCFLDGDLNGARNISNDFVDEKTLVTYKEELNVGNDISKADNGIDYNNLNLKHNNGLYYTKKTISQIFKDGANKIKIEPTDDKEFAMR